MFRIKELREARGLNMKEAARSLNMPYTTYVNYEKGLREPTSEVLIQIANFYDASIDYIVGRTSVIARPENSSPVGSNQAELIKNNASPLLPDESDLLHKYRALDDAAKGRIRNALEYEYASILGDTANATPKEA